MEGLGTKNTPRHDREPVNRVSGAMKIGLDDIAGCDSPERVGLVLLVRIQYVLRRSAGHRLYVGRGRGGHAAECIVEPHASLGVAEMSGGKGHHHSRAAAPDPALHEISLNWRLNNILNSLVERIHAFDGGQSFRVALLINFEKFRLQIEIKTHGRTIHRWRRR